ncbi:MAG: HAMP domain-containing histidine kinase [Clostridiales Family XIII bacterium]|jgi:signal transduction histidine kinase|nr:HAMP domain-containing histidine kinase [Clostridiales Family XIII bacterium]
MRNEDDSLKKYVNDLTHSLRMPLSIIIGYAELLKQGRVPDEATRRQYIGKIYDRATYMNEILSNFVSETEFDLGADNVVRVAVDVVGLIRGIAEDMKPVAEAEGVRIRVESEEKKIEVELDTVQWMKMFYNLVDNTLKYKGRKTDIWITVSTDGNGWLLVVFRDEGIGLPEAEIAHIFEPDYRGSNSSDGHGFGLHHAKHVVESHGGEISAKGGVGRGLGVYIRVPVSSPRAERRP